MISVRIAMKMAFLSYTTSQQKTTKCLRWKYIVCSFMPCKNNLRQIALEKTITATGWSTKIPINLKANAHYLPRAGSTGAPCHICPHTAETTAGSCLRPWTTSPEACLLPSHIQGTRDSFCDKYHSYFWGLKYSQILCVCVNAQTHEELHINIASY